MKDILENVRREVRIGDYGVVALIDTMPRLVTSGETLDHAVLQAARTSYGAQDKKSTPEEDRGLIRYLYRKNHVTPFEMVNVKWFHRLPIFVARQLIRHRTASVNEFSMRYKEPKDEFFTPDVSGVRKQSKVNKQGSEGSVPDDVATAFVDLTVATSDMAMENYKGAVATGIGKELARINLPVSIFTEWFWEIDLNNMLRVLALRMDKHAQKEIRDYADAMFELLSPLAPWTFEAFNDFSEYRGGMKLSRLEVAVLVDYVTKLRKDNNTIVSGLVSTKGEQDEWLVKCDQLGLS